MHRPSLTVFAEFRAKPGAEEQLGALLRNLIAPTRQEKGCLQYDLHLENDQPGHFIFYENWASMADLQAHVGSRHFTAFQGQSEHLVDGSVRIVLATRVD